MSLRFFVIKESTFMQQLAPSELILNNERVYHLGLHPFELADLIITVGDPNRVKMVSKYFDTVDIQISNREFETHTGYIGKKRITVISTGIGTDNIDIVLNELDALVNIDLKNRIYRPDKKPLTIVRIGTSGSIHPSVHVDDFLISDYALGLDGLLHFYDYNYSSEEQRLQKDFYAYLNQSKIALPVQPYIVSGNHDLIKDFNHDTFKKGIVLTAPGFYAPQGRNLRGVTKFAKQTIQHLTQFTFQELYLTNIEMETAGIYGLANHLGHRAISFNAILANRWEGTFSSNPTQTVEQLIQKVLDVLI
jgi:uridine phosphorylase